MLARRPGALPAATALASARAAGLFTEVHEAFWAAAWREHGDSAGTRTLIGALLLHRTLPREAVSAGMTAAIGLGRLEADLVAVEARRHLEALRAAPGPALEAAGPERGEQHRPPPTLGGYDALLAPLGVNA